MNVANNRMRNYCNIDKPLLAKDILLSLPNHDKPINSLKLIQDLCVFSSKAQKRTTCLPNQNEIKETLHRRLTMGHHISQFTVTNQHKSISN